MCFCFDYPFQADGKGIYFQHLIQCWVTDMKPFTRINYPYIPPPSPPTPLHFTLFSNTSLKDGSPIKVDTHFGRGWWGGLGAGRQ